MKQLYLLRASSGTAAPSFANQVMKEIVPALLALDPQRLKVHVPAPTPRFSLIPFRRDPIALFSLWGEKFDWAGLLGDRGGKLEGYRVTESVPVAYRRDWPDGQASPGIGLLTLMNRNPSMEYAEFMKEWHGRHTPKSLRIHPLWNYVRNVVEEPLVEGSPRFDGIVEEHFRSRSDLLNPVKFFGGAFWMLPHMVEVGLHVRRFLDMSTMENYLVTEHHIRS
jgi:hypothetical protein